MGQSMGTNAIAPERSCFRESGRFGSPRLIITNGKTFGFGVKFGAEVAYVSSWQKDLNRMPGIGGIFSLELAGINLTGGRRNRYAIFLLSLHAAVGIAKLYRKEGAMPETQTMEYTPRIGLNLHTIAFGFLSIALMGGYTVALFKEDGSKGYQKQQGAFAALAAEFFVSGLGKYLSPLITLTYSGYQHSHHELTASVGLRF